MDRGLREQSFACKASDRLIRLRSRDVSSTASKTLQTSVIAFSVYFRSEAPLLIPRPQELCTAWAWRLHCVIHLTIIHLLYQAVIRKLFLCEVVQDHIVDLHCGQISVSGGSSLRNLVLFSTRLHSNKNTQLTLFVFIANTSQLLLAFPLNL